VSTLTLRSEKFEFNGSVLEQQLFVLISAPQQLEFDFGFFSGFSFEQQLASFNESQQDNESFFSLLLFLSLLESLIFY
jgi:hypothetical protein